MSKLPFVTAEELKEDEYYYVKFVEGEETLALCRIETSRVDCNNDFEDVECEPYPVLWTIGGEFHFEVNQFEFFRGPIEIEL